MPKPLAGVNGSSMHTNISLKKDGKNVFADENDEYGLSQEAYWFIGGLMKHARGLSAITNPLVNSYKRLVPGPDWRGIHSSGLYLLGRPSIAAR